MLDTHILLWAIIADSKLPKEAIEIIMSKDNNVYYSTASIWEVTIKHTLHPDNMPLSGKELSEFCGEAGYKMLSICDKHVYVLETLSRSENAPKHNDPFDRIMLAQAKAEGMIFVTHDSLIPYYNEKCVKLV